MTADSLTKVIRDLRERAEAHRRSAAACVPDGLPQRYEISRAMLCDDIADRLDAIAARPYAWAWERADVPGEDQVRLTRYKPNHRVVNVRPLIIGSDDAETEQKRTGPAVTYGPGGNHGSMGPG